MTKRAETVVVNTLRIVLVLLIIACTGWYFLHPAPRSPKYIRLQASFAVLLPTNKSIRLQDWYYNPSDQTVSFVAYVNNQKVVFTEQALPLRYRDDRAAYDRFIGSLKPVANFRSPLGTVSLVRMVEVGTYTPGGDSAILAAQGTLLVAHPPDPITQDDWGLLFSTLRAEK